MKYFSSLLLLLLSLNSGAQCMMQELSLQEKIDRSDGVVLVYVSSSHAFSQDNMIYTSYECEILESAHHKLGDRIEVVLPGGRLGDEMWVVHPNMELKTRKRFVLFLKKSNKFSSAYELYSGAQGGILIQGDGRAFDAFHVYENVNEDLFPSLGISYRIGSQKPNRSAPAAVVSGFDPTSVSAGTGSHLRILGSGFGTFRGSGNVSFINANDGGGNAVFRVTDDEFYISWSENAIRMIVPGGYPGVAGSGPVKVVTNFGDSVVSAVEVEIVYAWMELWDEGSRILGNGVIYDENGFGGKDFVLNTDFTQITGAVPRFNSAIKTLRCRTGIGFDLAGFTPDTLVGNDDKNIARFENGNELPDGTLGTTYLMFAGCQQSGIWHWWCHEADILFDDAAKWNFDDSLPKWDEMDFESVVLHELGHAAMMAHVQGVTQTMFPTINSGEYRRVPDTIGAKAGIAEMMNLSTQDVPCFAGIEGATWFDTTVCSFVGVDEIDQMNFEIVPSLSRDYIRIHLSKSHSNSASHSLSISITDISGKTLFAKEAENHELIDISTFSVGMYFVRVVDGEGVGRIERFVKY